MDAPNQLVPQRRVHRAVSFDARHRPEGSSFDAHLEMALPPFLISCMTPVTLTFVNDLKQIGLERLVQLGSHFVFNTHFSHSTPSISGPTSYTLASESER